MFSLYRRISPPDAPALSTTPLFFRLRSGMRTVAISQKLDRLLGSAEHPGGNVTARRTPILQGLPSRPGKFDSVFLPGLMNGRGKNGLQCGIFQHVPIPTHNPPASLPADYPLSLIASGCGGILVVRRGNAQVRLSATQGFLGRNRRVP